MGTRLCLGTAQLGMNYGVASSRGRPSSSEIDRIFGAAMDLGVDQIDTAAVYGEAETVVGHFLKSRGRGWRVRVGTKLPRLPGGLSPSALRDRVTLAVDRSRSKLDLDVIDDFLIHSLHDLREYGASLVGALEDQKGRGRVRRIGVSVYDAEDVRLSMVHPELATTQFPFSAFERHLVDGGLVQRLRLAGHETFARSCLQQGLLALSPDRAEAAVPGAGPWVARFHASCAAHDVDPVTGAIGYAATKSGASYLVVGVESAEQLRAVSAALARKASLALVRDVDEGFEGVPLAVRDPRQWSGAA